MTKAVKENDCTTCVNDKGCVSCENGELYESAGEDLKESARYYLLNNHVSPLNDILHQADLKVEMQYHKDIENAFKAGAEWQKQQMMKDAVDCVFGSRATSSFVNDFPNIEIGDKVKIIIIKED